MKKTVLSILVIWTFLGFYSVKTANAQPIRVPRSVQEIKGIEVFNVKSPPYGAVGNGVADDTVAIAAAITAANAAPNGGIVVFPAGTFSYSTTPATGSSKVILRGAGRGATYLKPTGAIGVGLYVGVASGATAINQTIVEDLTIDGSATTGNVDGIRFRNCTRSAANRVQAINFPNGAGFRFADSNWINVIRDCRTADCKYGIQFKSVAGTTQVGNSTTIIGGEHGPGCDYAVVIGNEAGTSNQSPSVGYGITLEDISIEGTDGAAAVVIAEGDNPRVLHCNFEANVGVDIQLGTSGGCAPRRPLVMFNSTASFASANHTFLKDVSTSGPEGLTSAYNHLDIGGASGTKKGFEITVANASYTDLGPDFFGAGITSGNRYVVPSNSQAHITRNDVSGTAWHEAAHGAFGFKQTDTASLSPDILQLYNNADTMIMKLGGRLGIYPDTGYTSRIIQVTQPGSGSNGTEVIAFDYLGAGTFLSLKLTNGVNAGSLLASGNTSTGSLTVTNGITAGSISLTTPLPSSSGGIGTSTFAVGDLIYASGTGTLARLADVATGQVLASGGANTAPAYTAAPTLNSISTGSITNTNGLSSGSMTATNAITGGSFTLGGGTNLFNVTSGGSVGIGTTTAGIAETFHLVGRGRFENTNQVFLRNSSTNGSGLDLDLSFKNASSAVVTIAQVESALRANGAGSESGDMYLKAKQAGSLQNFMQLQGSSYNIGLFGLNTYSGQKVIAIGDAGVVPSANATGGGYLYSDSGALKWRGSSGTTTTLGPAHPHCPKCGRDFMVEWNNPKYGGLEVCMWCLTEELGDRPYVVRKKPSLPIIVRFGY